MSIGFFRVYALFSFFFVGEKLPRWVVCVFSHFCSWSLVKPVVYKYMLSEALSPVIVQFTDIWKHIKGPSLRLHT